MQFEDQGGDVPPDPSGSSPSPTEGEPARPAESRPTPSLRDQLAAFRRPPTAGVDPYARSLDSAAWKLLEVSRELSSIHDESELLRRLLDQAISLTGAERGMVLSWEEAVGFELREARGHTGDTLPPEDALFSQSLSLRAIEDNQIVRYDSATAIETGELTVSQARLNLAQAVAVPLRRRGTPFGVLYLDSAGRRMALPGEELTLVLQALAAHVSVALVTAATIVELEDQRSSLEQRNQSLLAEVSGGTGIEELVGESSAMRLLAHRVLQLADLELPVLVRGEPGVGKDVVSRALHTKSYRRSKPFLTVNCPALTPDLGPAELFGHARGAFTSSVRDRKGLVEEADGGTLFFDEIGDLPLKIQPMLLIFLQRGTFTRVGENAERHARVRVVAATNRDLPGMVKAGLFREDLYDRLDGITLEIPPLRERREDILRLAQHFVDVQEKAKPRGVTGFTRRAIQALQNHEWPGNVRILENSVTLGHGLAPAGGLIDIEHMGDKFAKLLSPEQTPEPPKGRISLADAMSWAERQAIVEALARNRWNIAKSAIELGISRQHLHNRIRHYEMRRPEPRRQEAPGDTFFH